MLHSVPTDAYFINQSQAYNYLIWVFIQSDGHAVVFVTRKIHSVIRYLYDLHHKNTSRH